MYYGQSLTHNDTKDSFAASDRSHSHIHNQVQVNKHESCKLEMCVAQGYVGAVLQLIGCIIGNKDGEFDRLVNAAGVPPSTLSMFELLHRKPHIKHAHQKSHKGFATRLCNQAI